LSRLQGVDPNGSTGSPSDGPNNMGNNMGNNMQPIDQLRAILPALTGVVEQIEPSELAAATPCDEFSVHDILDHMIVGATTFAAAFRGEPAPDVRPPAVYGRVPVAEFTEAMDALLAAVESEDALDRMIPTPLGELPGAQFAALVALDGLVHAWDLAVATDAHLQMTPEVVSSVSSFAAAAITDEVRATGMFAAATEAPADATGLEVLAGLTGRAVVPRWRSPRSLHVDKHAVPTKIDVPGAHARQLTGFGNATGYGSFAGEYFSLAAGTDIAPLLAGLEDDVCHAPHWGYMIDGEVVVTYVDGAESTCVAGEIFYWPPGHSVRVVTDAEVVLFSPEREHVAVLDHMLGRMALAGA
jgi:uncharacterized protein (TIGR03086 family)